MNLEESELFRDCFMFDLTKYIYDEYKDNNNIIFDLCVKKDVYDSIREHNGEFYCDERIFTLKCFMTELIGLGYNCDYHINLTMKETDMSIRNRKIKELGL